MNFVIKNKISLENIFVSASSNISAEWEFHLKYVRKKLSLQCKTNKYDSETIE